MNYKIKPNCSIIFLSTVNFNTSPFPHGRFPRNFSRIFCGNNSVFHSPFTSQETVKIPFLLFCKSIFCILRCTSPEMKRGIPLWCPKGSPPFAAVISQKPTTTPSFNMLSTFCDICQNFHVYKLSFWIKKRKSTPVFR